MPAMQVDVSEQETRKLISDATQKGDRFRIKVMRRLPSGGIEVVALFEEGRLDHVTYPEKWLPELAGGGNYILHVYHDSQPAEMIGGGIPFTVANLQPTKVDFDAVTSPGWSGPTGMQYPKQPQQRQRYAGATTVDGAPQWSATAVDIPAGGMTPVRTVGPDLDAMARAQRAEAALADMQKRWEVDGLRRDHAQQMDKMQQAMNQLRDELRAQHAAQAAQPRESTGKLIAEALAPLAPVLLAVINGQNEIRKEMLIQQAKSADLHLAAGREQSAQLEKVLTALLTKPNTIDPAMQLLLEHMKTANTSPILTDVITAFSAMSQSTLQVMTAATDSGLLGNREGGVGDIVREVAQAAGSFFEMMGNRQAQAMGVRPQQMPYRRLPPPQGMPGQPPMPQQPQPSAFAQLDTLIKSHHDPQAVAQGFLAALSNDADLRERFAQQQNDIEAFFRAYWGPWAQSNVAAHGPYVAQLYDAVVREAQRRGWLQAPAAGAQPQAAPQPVPQPVPRPQPAPVRAQGQGDYPPEGQGLYPEPGDEPVDPGYEDPMTQDGEEDGVGMNADDEEEEDT